MSLLWRIMRPLVVPPVRLGLRVKVRGKRHIPKTGAAILASNHLSALDHIVLPAVTRRPIVNISKVEHFERRLKAWFFRQWHVIPLRRGAGDREALAKAREALAAGHLFCIYPEGTRSLDGKLHKGHTGVARLALEMHVPIIPVAMKGTFEAKPKGGRLRLFRPCEAIVGEPLDVSEHWDRQDDYDLCRRITDEVMHRIAEVSGQEYVDEYQYTPSARSRAEGGQATGARETVGREEG